MAIWFEPSTQDYVYQNNRNGFNLYHHSYSDDLLFLGTDRWAVHFDINNILSIPIEEEEEPINFIINAINIFMPETTSNITVSLHEPLIPPTGVTAVQPGTVIFSTTTTLERGWNTISLAQPTTVSQAWIVVDLPNRANDIPVSASWGTGFNSYYFERYNATSGTFRNMNNYGFMADFLFHLVGSFSTDVVMIDIIESNNPTYLNLGQPFIPNLTIRNNSSISTNNIFIDIDIRNIAVLSKVENGIRVDDPIIDRINISSTMSPGQQITIDERMYSGVSLPDNVHAQYQINIRTGTNNENVKFLARYLTTIINVFPFSKPQTLLEIFTLSADRLNEDIINYIENDLDSNKLDVIFHFPNSIDRLYQWAAYQRGTQYQHQGFQHIYFNGTQSNRVFQDTEFFLKFQNVYDSTITEKTFIKQSYEDIWINKEMYLVIDLDFTNRISELGDDVTYEGTYLLTTEQTDFTLNAAFVQTTSFLDRDIKILTQYITSTQAPVINLQYASGDQEIRFMFPLYNIYYLPGIEFEDLEVLVWIQRRATNKVLYHEFFSLKDVEFPDDDDDDDDDDEDEKPEVKIHLFPNPISQDDDLLIDFVNSREQNEIQLSIYNIRGQRVINTFINEPKINMSKLNINTSGIYFVRVSWIENDKKQIQTKRIMILK